MLHARTHTRGSTPRSGRRFARLGSDSAAFAELVRAVRPKLIVEVGTWKGASAIRMAEEAPVPAGFADSLHRYLARRAGVLDGSGGPRAVQEPATEERLAAGVLPIPRERLPQGPSATDHSFPQTSATGALWLRYSDSRDLIYVDASHEEEDVMATSSPTGRSRAGRRNLWRRLELGWRAPRRAAVCPEVELTYRFIADKWVLRQAGHEAGIGATILLPQS
jgi:hypothetical protein